MQTDTEQRQWDAYVRRVVRTGSFSADIVKTMVESGWSEGDAYRLVQHHIAKERWKAAGILVGFAILALTALAVTIGSYNAATAHGGGGFYVVWYGGIIGGGVGSLWGLLRLMRIRS